MDVAAAHTVGRSGDSNRCLSELKVI
jgi:hypothetical protein